MYLVTAEQMRMIDRQAINGIGLTAAVLIENAGRAVAETVLELWQTSTTPAKMQKWLVLVGKGHNGADGIACARHLSELGMQVTLMFAGAHVNLTVETAKQYQIAVALGIPVMFYGQTQLDWDDYDGIVDGLLGSGSDGPPRKTYADIINDANESGLPIVAIDLPSGLNCDTGAVYEPCIRAKVTVALAFLKCGLTQYPGAAMAGEILVKPIGIMPSLAHDFGVNTLLLDSLAFTEHLGTATQPTRQPNANKGSFGHLLIAAGSRAMSGAGLLCARAAIRSGCGLVTWTIPDALVDQMMGHAPEVMLRGMTDQGRGDWEKTLPEQLLAAAAGKAAMVVGPGMGRFNGDSAWLRRLWEGAQCPMVVDADALNMIADAADFAAWGRREAAVVMTPHPGEMARLAGVPVHEVQRDRIGLARRYAVQHGVTLVLKGARTVCASPDGVVFVNTTGNPGMATAGAGDVLAGMIGSLLAQNHTALQAACLAVYLHGAAGDRALAARKTALFAQALIASDIIQQL